ncbi:MAG TPA: hypothetical protein VGC14_26315 [Rhizobium sp.]
MSPSGDFFESALSAHLFMFLFGWIFRCKTLEEGHRQAADLIRRSTVHTNKMLKKLSKQELIRLRGCGCGLLPSGRFARLPIRNGSIRASDRSADLRR